MKDGLKSDSYKVRLIAVAAIAKTKDKEAAALIKPLLADKEPAVRAAAVDGLALLKDVGSYDAVFALNNDADPAVRAVVTRALDALATNLLAIDTGDATDLSGKATPAQVTKLQTLFEAELKKLSKGVKAVHGGVTKGYGALLKIRSVTKTQDGGNEILQVKCDMTLVEYPGKVLRLTSSATAGAGVEGTISPKMEPDLLNDGLDACAPSLAKDFADYLENRLGR